MTDPKPDAIRLLTEAGVDSARLDARLLWEHAQRNAAVFKELVARRAAREPLAYITGHKEFWSLEFDVGPGVLVPRPETETIVEQVMACFPDPATRLNVLDLGTGTGCLLIAILKEFPNSRGLGIDRSAQAQRVARTNLANHGLTERGEIRAGNWADGLQDRWDVIVSNPPYIKSDDVAGLAPEVARYEPKGALDGGPDGLGAIKPLAAAMARLLDGYGFVEIGAGQAEDAASVMTATGLEVVRTASDLAGIPRVLVARPAGRTPGHGAKKELE